MQGRKQNGEFTTSNYVILTLVCGDLCSVICIVSTNYLYLSVLFWELINCSKGKSIRDIRNGRVFAETNRKFPKVVEFEKISIFTELIIK